MTTIDIPPIQAGGTHTGSSTLTTEEVKRRIGLMFGDITDTPEDPVAEKLAESLG